MKFKKYGSSFAVVLLSAFILSSPAMAHCGKCGMGKGFDPEKKSEKLQKKLDLSDEQTAQVKSILEKYDLSKDETIKKMKEDLMAAKKQRHENMRSELNAVLTEEQRAKYEKMKDEWDDKKKDKKHCPFHGKEEGDTKE
jgi:Spy/CpxP family protein refolding chaperone